MFPEIPYFQRPQARYHAIMVCGQSLAGGTFGSPLTAAAKIPSPNHLMTGDGLWIRSNSDDVADTIWRRYPRMRPLREHLAWDNSNIGQTGWLAFGEYINNKVGTFNHNVAFATAAVGGSAYVTLSKTGNTISEITRSGSTATATTVGHFPGSGAHQLVVGHRVIVSGSDAPEYNGSHLITATGAFTFDFTVSGTPATSNNAGIRWRTLHYQQSLDKAVMIRKQLQNVIPSACLCVHAEGDNGNTIYDTEIRDWQSDYQSDLNDVYLTNAIIPMFHSQASAWTKLGGATTSVAAYKLIDEHLANPTLTRLVCPKYFLEHATDGLHLARDSYDILGEYYAKAYYKHCILRQTWEPLRPTQTSRAGAVITIDFTGNVGNLVFDTTNVTDPNTFKGFEYTDDSSPPAISSVAISGPSQVQVTLASTPTGANKKIRYAYTGVSNNDGGPTDGPRGNLRDSETEVGPTSGETLCNWCVHFNEDVA